jgi:hypothetical protein
MYILLNLTIKVFFSHNTFLFEQPKIWLAGSIPTSYSMVCFFLMAFWAAGGKINFLREGDLNLQPPLNAL